MEEFQVALEPLIDDGNVDLGGEFREKFRSTKPPAPAHGRTLINHSDILSTKVSIGMMGHGTLTPNGEEASLLVIDFRLISTKTTRRFRSASFQLIFYDAEGEEKFDPDVYRISPLGVFSIDPQVDSGKVTDHFNLELNGGLPQAGGKASYGRDIEKDQTYEHSVSLTGQTKLLDKDSGEDNAVLWTMEEDKKKKLGIPSFLRTAVILRRKPGRKFNFGLEAETKGNFDFNDKVKRLSHLGREQTVPLDTLQIDPLSYVLKAEDLFLTEYAARIAWTKLHELDLQNDLVNHTMREVLRARSNEKKAEKTRQDAETKAMAADGNMGKPVM